ncbi:Uncharacterised protein [Mycobacteroides abscessus subsp. abscessus]|nr:Uncharacterised protein [Mycobacteroides abscessus subsp. abscessus]
MVGSHSLARVNAFVACALLSTGSVPSTGIPSESTPSSKSCRALRTSVIIPPKVRLNRFA